MNATIPHDRADTKNIKEPAPGNPAPAEPAGGSATPGADRDSRGRFVAGNKSGHGNPFARRTARMRSFLLEAVTDEDMQIIAQKLVEQAKAGDLAAMKLLFGYVIGKPIPCTDPDRLDVEEWQLRHAAPEQEELNKMVKNNLPPDLACLFARLVLEQNESDVLATLSKRRADVASTRVPRAEGINALARPVPPSREGRKCHAAPSANGLSGHASPSTNGTNGHAAASSTNGTNGHVSPSPNAKNGHIAPSTNGQNGYARPSANGGNSPAPTSANGKNGHAAPSANGGNGQTPASANGASTAADTPPAPTGRRS